MNRWLPVIVLLTAVTVIPSSRSVGSTPFPPGSGQVGRTFAVVGSSADQQRDDERAAASLVKAGVPLERDVQGRVRWIEAANGELSDEAMSHLPSLPKLEWLEIGGGKITAAGMTHLKDCSALRRLYVHDISLSDDALACPAHYPQK